MLIRRLSHTKCTPLGVWNIAYTVFFLLFFGLLSLQEPPVSAANTAGLSFGFGNGDNVSKGMIVSVSQTDTNTVEQAHVNNDDFVVGVIVNQNSSSVVFDNNDGVYVANEGTVEIFVSDIAGEIKNGDLITVSTIGGVGAKKDDSIRNQKIVGVAASDFDANAATTQTVTLENNGEVRIGKVSVELLIGEGADTVNEGNNINVLVRIGTAIAGKPVSLAQVLITASVVIVAFVVSGAILFGSVKGSFTSIGRNPLSANTIYRGMMRVSFVALGVMFLGVIGGYVVLIL